MEMIETEVDLNSQDGRWWRFSEYTIEKGAIIPASSTKLSRYDPWLGHVGNVGKRRTIQAAYSSLIELSKRLTFKPTERTSYAATEESTAAILDWVQRFGLLGILPATAEVITMAPWWVERSEYFGPDAAGLCVQQRRYLRRAGVWFRADNTIDIEEPPDSLDTPRDWWKCIPKGAAAGNDTLDWWLPRPTVTFWNWRKGNLVDRELWRLKRYFPNVDTSIQVMGSIRMDLAASGHYWPMPCSAEFWYQYAEPVDLFARWVDRFTQATNALGRWNKRITDSLDFTRAMSIMQGLDGSIGQEWRMNPTSANPQSVTVSPSLLATFARMVLEDMAGGRRIFTCETCVKVFISDEPRSKYCSTRCRHTMQRRRQRAKDEE